MRRERNILISTRFYLHGHVSFGLIFLLRLPKTVQLFPQAENIEPNEEEQVTEQMEEPTEEPTEKKMEDDDENPF